MGDYYDFRTDSEGNTLPKEEVVYIHGQARCKE